MKPSQQLLWGLGRFSSYLYSWRAYRLRSDATSQHRAACCHKALDDVGETIRSLVDRLLVVSRFIAAAHHRPTNRTTP